MREFVAGLFYTSVLIILGILGILAYDHFGPLRVSDMYVTTIDPAVDKDADPAEGPFQIGSTVYIVAKLKGAGTETLSFLVWRNGSRYHNWSSVNESDLLWFTLEDLPPGNYIVYSLQNGGLKQIEFGVE